MASFDAKYEFNAPKYIDFLQGDIDEDADKWFDTRDGDEGGIDIDMVPYYEQNIGFKNATNAISAALADNMKEIQQVKTYSLITNDNETSNNVEIAENVANKENIVPDVVIPKECAIINKDSVKCDNSKKENFLMLKVEQQNLNSSSVDETLVQKSNIRTSWSSPDVTREDIRKVQPPRSVKKSINYDVSKKRKTVSTTDPTVNKKSRVESKPLIMPETPSFIRKLRERGTKKDLQTSEALNIQKMRELQKQTKAKIRRNDKQLKNVLGASSYLPSRSTCPVTKPKEFHFATDDRIKEHTMQTRSDTICKPFESQLRQHPPSPPFKKEVTKPQPFNFSTQSSKVAGPVKAEWESMAHLALKFQTKTPERFRMKPKRCDNNGSLELEKPNHPFHVTNPKTPNLATKTRTRPVTAISRQEMEEKEAEEISNYHFKATEFNPKIIEKGGFYGVKQIPEAHTTKPKPFNFLIENRIEQRKQKEEPLPQTNKVHPKSNTSIGKTERPKNTELEPFSFENRDKERYLKKEEKIKEIIEDEEKMHEFHARPLPSFSPDSLPPVQPKESTHPIPFKISTGSSSYQQKLQEKRHKEIETEKLNREFKAKPADVINKAPFKPLTGLIPPTEITDFTLNSDIRAKERQKYEEWKHEQELKTEEEKKRIEKEKALEVEREIKAMREEAVVKANPVRTYKPVIIEHSSKQLTEPQTPNLQTKKRAMRL
ncbi:targeting protein for Xklp2 homolog isoform X2 [Hydra vulgaris]|uniref:Targeting protein for Xklp2 homolog isoform X2 n=1 Tax=Hydra vulgaris TaxID=6087 RepID=A0ABM4DNW3_HYDVU